MGIKGQFCRVSSRALKEFNSGHHRAQACTPTPLPTDLPHWLRMSLKFWWGMHWGYTLLWSCSHFHSVNSYYTWAPIGSWPSYDAKYIGSNFKSCHILLTVQTLFKSPKCRISSKNQGKLLTVTQPPPIKFEKKNKNKLISKQNIKQNVSYIRLTYSGTGYTFLFPKGGIGAYWGHT